MSRQGLVDTVMITLAIPFLTINWASGKVLDALLGPEEDFEYRPIEPPIWIVP